MIFFYLFPDLGASIENMYCPGWVPVWVNNFISAVGETTCLTLLGHLVSFFSFHVDSLDSVLHTAFLEVMSCELALIYFETSKATPTLA